MYSPSLLDTDILSELFRGNPTVKTRASEYLNDHNQLTISLITKYEILKGLNAKKAQKQIDSFIAFCNANVVLPITDDVIIKAADIYAILRGQGTIISDADIIVASIAVVNKLVLVTNNTNHFSRIQGLLLHNWKVLLGERK